MDGVATELLYRATLTYRPSPPLAFDVEFLNCPSLTF